MNDQQTLFLLSDARENICQSMALLRAIGPYYPDLARKELPRIRSLAERQIRLERRAEIQAPQLGFPIALVVMGGMSLLGLGGWVFKHHEETSLERYKMESIAKCIEENINAGMNRPEATRICGELFTGKNLASVFKELSKTLVIASVAITGIYIFLRWKN